MRFSSFPTQTFHTIGWKDNYGYAWNRIIFFLLLFIFSIYFKTEIHFFGVCSSLLPHTIKKGKIHDMAPVKITKIKNKRKKLDRPKSILCLINECLQANVIHIQVKCLITRMLLSIDFTDIQDDYSLLFTDFFLPAILHFLLSLLSIAFDWMDWGLYIHI